FYKPVVNLKFEPKQEDVMELRLQSKQSEGPGAMSYICKAATPLSWTAGQLLYCVLHHEPTDNCGSDRWFTIASAPSQKTVMLTPRLMDEKGSTFKQALEPLNAGDVMEVSDLKTPLFYVSGPEPMVEHLDQMLQDLGVPADHLKQDWFPGYPAEQIARRWSP
ncbi:MAG: hypothetical protein PHO14_02430, partial [Kiritimatiellae bacterium]|nr:hypothetical protein [Kiritimatiellia bacterium]